MKLKYFLYCTTSLACLTLALPSQTAATLSSKDQLTTSVFNSALHGHLEENKFESRGHLLAKRFAIFGLFGSNEKCPKGTFGSPGSCQSCGECFDYWDKEVQRLRNDTQALLDRVKLLLKIGTNGAFAKEFAEIENKLNKIQRILEGQKLDEATIRDLARKLEEMMEMLRRLEKILYQYENDAEKTSNRTFAVNLALDEMQRQTELLMLRIIGLRENATLFQEANVDGAYKIILDSQNRSREAEKQVRNLKPLMMEQEHKRRLAETLFASTSARFNSSSNTNEALLAALAKQIAELESNIPGINQLTCASNSTVNYCEPLCGGALCNKCGGISCSQGATTKASNALDLAQQAMALLASKYNQSKLNLNALDEIKALSDEALRLAKQVLFDCENQRIKFDSIAKELSDILDGIDKFALLDGARPAEVRVLGTECLQLSISLKPEQILELAAKINETISSLTNIEKILAETANDLNTAEQLHQQADRAKQMADNLLETIELVLRMLAEAALEQAKAAAEIAAAAQHIEGAQADLKEVSEESERWSLVISQLLEMMKKLKERLADLRKKFAQNELYVKQAKAAAEEAGKLTDEAERITNELADKVREAEEKLRNKLKLNGELNERAERFRNEAMQLGDDVRNKTNTLRDLDDLFDEFLKRVTFYQDTVDDLNKQMNTYLVDIDLRAQYYRECQP